MTDKNDENIRLLKEQLLWQKIASVGVIGIFAVVLISALMIVPKVTETLSNINNVAMEAGETVGNADEMISEMTKASKNLNNVIDENGEDLTNTMNAIAGIDFEGLNEAITELKDTIGPLATFMKRFR